MQTAITALACSKTERVSRIHGNLAALPRSGAAMTVSLNLRDLMKHGLKVLKAQRFALALQN